MPPALVSGSSSGRTLRSCSARPWPRPFSLVPQPFLPAALRVTAAAPPPSWARRALPTPAGSWQPRPRRRRAAPAFFPLGCGGLGRGWGRGSSPNAGDFYSSLCALWNPQSTLGFYFYPSPVLPCAGEIRQGPLPILPSPSNLTPRVGEMHLPPKSGQKLVSDLPLPRR